MCGRFTLILTTEMLAEIFGLTELPRIEPRYNIAPSQQVAAIRTLADNEHREVAMLKWGLIPRWAKDPSIGHKMINARAETIAEKPSFREPFKRRRCLILADGFYEWHKDPRGRHTVPM